MFDRDLEHPVITNLCRTGYPDSKEPEEMRCPVCGEDAEFFYTTTTGRTIVGCERCLITRHYWEFEEGELS